MSHMTSVVAAMPNTTGTNTDATRSARCSIGALRLCASSTSRAIRARAESRPTRVVSTTNEPDEFIVAPKTSSPGPLSTGTDSPVSIDSSTDDMPSRTTPSVGHLRARPHPDQIAHRDVLQWDLEFDAIPDHDRRLGTELHQRPDRARRSALRSMLEVLAEQEEAHDHCGGLEVQVSPVDQCVGRVENRARAFRPRPGCPCSPRGGGPASMRLRGTCGPPRTRPEARARTAPTVTTPAPPCRRLGRTSPDKGGGGSGVRKERTAARPSRYARPRRRSLCRDRGPHALLGRARRGRTPLPRPRPGEPRNLVRRPRPSLVRGRSSPPHSTPPAAWPTCARPAARTRRRSSLRRRT